MNQFYVSFKQELLPNCPSVHQWGGERIPTDLNRNVFPLN